jgi:hypothetical protein
VQQPGGTPPPFLEHTFCLAFDMLNIAQSYEGMTSAMLHGWQLLDWLEV